MIGEIRFYLTVFLKRSPILVLIASIVTAIGVALALSLPAKFKADALLLLESPQISEDQVVSTVQTAALEQLEIMEQRLLARSNLIDIANKVGVFDNRENRMFPDEIVEAMRDSTEFSTTTGRDRASLFSISFEAESGEIAAGVVNEYVTRMLAENVALRTDRAEETLEFFQLEVNQLGANLDRQGQRILEFKNANLGALPDSLDFRLRQQSDMQERVSQINREVATYNEQKERLSRIFEATGGFGGVAPDNRSDEEKQLDQLRDELTNALAIYSSTNPRVKLLEARIEALEKTIGAKPDPENDASTPAPLSALDLQLAEIDGFISALNIEKDSLQTDLEKLTESIAATPTVSITLEALQRDYDNIQIQYNAAVDRLSTAETGERIELLSKGERISVIRQPVIPREPNSPNRRLIAAGSAAIGVALGVGLIAVLELFNRSIRRPVDLTRGLGLAPIATLPYSKPVGVSGGRRMLLIAILLLLSLSLPVGMYLVHTLYLPIDQIVAIILAAIGA